jgi:Sec-independent protein translocase protein TatA
VLKNLVVWAEVKGTVLGRMFDISLSELGIISVVAFLVLGPKEFANAVHYIKHNINSLKRWWQHNIPNAQDLVSRHQQVDDNVVKYIMDLEGNMRATYDLSSITPDITKNRVSKQKHKIQHEPKAKKIEA